MSSKTISEATQQKVDAEIRRILDEQYALARKLIEENRDKIEAMVAALLEFETIDSDQISDIMAGLPVRQPKPTQSKITPAAGGSSTPPGPAATPAPQPSAKTE